MNYFRGLYLFIQNRRVPFFIVPSSHSTHTWKFWKYKKTNIVDLNEFISSQLYVFWINCIGHVSVEIDYILPIFTENNVWISICYTDNGQKYQYKYFKMSERDFYRFYRPTIRNLFISNKNKIDNCSWAKYGF